MIKLQEKQQNDYQSLKIHMEEYPVGFVKILKINNKKDASNFKKNLFFFTENYDYLFSKEFLYPPIL
jgi:hypothetical protein